MIRKGIGLSYRLGASGPCKKKEPSSASACLRQRKFVLSEKAPKHDCSIRNLSDTRACLQVSTTYGIPTNFEIIIEGERVGRLVRLQE